MEDKVLCVDDDPNLLEALRRQLGRDFNLYTALGAEPALESISDQGPFAVIVSDMRMPGIDGIQFLRRAREIAPDTVRIMLTGTAELRIAMDAVNEGNIFRFLTKPCSSENLAGAMSAGIQQYRLVTAERKLLEETVSGSIRTLTEMLSIVDPQSFGRAEILRQNAKIVAERMKIINAWELETAASLSQLGFVTVPPDVTKKLLAGRPISDREKEMVARVPEVSRGLVANIPRLEGVARIIAHENKHFDGSGLPSDGISGESIPIGSRILKVLIDLVQIEMLEVPRLKAFHLMRRRQGWYDPEVLDLVLSCLLPVQPGSSVKSDAVDSSPDQIDAKEPPLEGITLNELRVGHVLGSDLRTSDGLLLLAAGHVISQTSLFRVRNISHNSPVRQPIYVKLR